ncbi:HtaA domain-containing protein [Solirubrobacter ginsenosidimutans]|uniref:HtaA domain-containing protein n=1 Tax=Solirubrobacter ginsenosidimutans TaxID=490573 RepID=A0A9X3MV40_9ACTN|nr:HtaA domain-containing protein [Solirubrobacter ginsenosidimutans]MDA0163179.1 HtaA domain-containing protein [Solirubrobacter ginsenosidimutans]
MRKLLTAALAATAAMAVAAPAAQAATLTVTGGKLEWTIPNQLSSFADPTATWLGYVTFNQVGNPGSSNGTAAATAPATLTGPDGNSAASVTPDSARGADQKYTFGYPAASGTYTENGVGSIETTGTVTFTVHGSPITVVNPLITLNGLTGTLKASGVTANQLGQTSTYDRSKTQLNLDLSAATVTLRADGSRMIDGIVPSNEPGSVLDGFGPNARRYGTMKLTLGLSYPEPGTGPAGEKGDAGEPGTAVLGSPGAAGPQGPAGPAGPRGPAGKSAKISTFTLKKAPFAGSAKRSVKLLQRKTGKVLATGTLQRRKLRLAALEGTKLKGSFVVKLAHGTRRATVTLK